MSRKHVYTVAKHGTALGGEGYAVAKFDKALGTLEATYEVMQVKHRGLSCNCPVGLNRRGRSCRHRTMIGVFKKAKKLGSGALYDFEAGRWLT